MKITARQLRRIIKEAASRLSEASDMASLTGSRSPLVVRSYIKNMMRARTSSLVLDDMTELWNHMTELPGDVAHARSIAEELGLSPALASFHARKMDTGEVYPTGEELKAAVEAVGPPKPPAPRPKKPYGGGTRQRPWDEST
jgi:hypothetical protein